MYKTNNCDSISIFSIFLNDCMQNCMPVWPNIVASSSVKKILFDKEGID